MNLRALSASTLAIATVLSVGIANADSLAVSCSGAPASSSITWNATSTGGVSPVAFLWGDGSTSTTRTITYAPGTYSMTIQGTDASSSVATSTCSASVAQPLPTISSFTALPASIYVGQSSVLSWSVSNASSTSIDNGVGAQTGTSVVVSPSTTTTYTLFAANPTGTSTASATVTVSPTSTSTSTPSGIQAQIQALLQQIQQLQQQLMTLLRGQVGTTTPPIVPPGQIGKQMCISLNRNLREGDSGDDVRNLQQLLAQDPQYGFNATTTGYFGPMTARALIRFQMRNGIASSSAGLVGPLTRGYFERNCGRGLDNSESENGSASSSASAGLNAAIRGIPSIQMPNIPAMISNLLPHGDGNGNSNGRGQGHGDN